MMLSEEPLSCSVEREQESGDTQSKDTREVAVSERQVRDGEKGTKARDS